MPKIDLPSTLLRPHEARQALGIGATTLNKFCHEGKLTPIRFSARCVRFRASEILALIDAHAKKGGAS